MNKVTIYHGDEVIHTHNRICAGFENWRRANVKNTILKNFGGERKYPVLEVVQYPFSFCALLTKSGSTKYPIGEVIATADIGRAAPMRVDTGSINVTESYLTSRKMHLVFDFSTQTTGTIKGIVFSSSSTSSSTSDVNQVQTDLLKGSAGGVETHGSIYENYYYYTKNKKIYRFKI